MPKITRRKIARGTKLKPSKVQTPLSNLANQLNAANTAIPAPSTAVTKSQYSKRNATFRLNFTLPYLGSEWTRVNGVETPYVIPFMLPPLQEFWNVSQIEPDYAPKVKLVEVSFGFDQRGEAGLITDQWCSSGPIDAAGTGANKTWIDLLAPSANDISDLDTFQTNSNHGKIYGTVADADLTELKSRGPLVLSVHRKEADYYTSGIADVPYQEIYTLPIVIENFIGTELKLNPYRERDLSFDIDQYSTYMLGIRPPNLHAITDYALLHGINLALVNLTVSLKFKSELIQRDSTLGSDDPLNIPENGLLKTNSTVAITTPVAGNTINADGADGVQTSINTIDQVYQAKLKGGVSSLSDTGIIENVCEDAAYDVIAIPMWNNQWNNQLTGKHAYSTGTGPYQYGVEAGNRINTAGDNAQPLCDRAIIPFSYPMTIHHVIVAHNNLLTTNVKQAYSEYNYAYEFGPIPGNVIGPATWANTARVAAKHSIGIGVGTGNMGTHYGYKQIVNYEGTLTDYNVDTIKMDYNATSIAPDLVAGTQANFPEGVSEYDLSTYPDWRLCYLPIKNQPAAIDEIAPGLYDFAGTKATTTTFQNMQNPPFFIGNSYLSPKASMGQLATAGAAVGTSVRNSVSGGAYNNRSLDQWLEVRWSIGPDGDDPAHTWSTWNNVQTPAASISGDHSRILNGYGGSWIYIICKKHTVSDQNWQLPYHTKGL